MEKSENEISDEDLRAALKEIKTYVDITEEDLRKIYAIALRHARERSISKVPVRNVMTRAVVAIRKGDGINEAARLLSEHKISGLPVVDEGNHVLGIVSEADILSMAGLQRGHTFKDVLRHILGEPLPERKTGDKVGDIMSSPAITVRPASDIHEAARILDERRIKRLPVVDADDRLVGIISRADIVKVIGGK
ncbi:MAG TPA: CBS domain-containing protein [Thermodesulfovibrionales bacterium]|nr:CBS domain-containing protein [Thermodesulfovibrionales bacterium]